MIAFDAFSVGANQSPGTAPLTWNHTCTGSDRLLLVIGKGNGVVTGITYNSVAMTKLISVTDPNYGVLEIWGLLNPASGVNTVSATWAGSQYVSLSSVSYTGVSQTGLPDATATKTQTSNTSIAHVITPVAATTWIIGGAIAASPSGTYTMTLATAGYSKRGTGTPDNFILYDSNAVVPAGSNTVTINIASASAASMALITIADVDQPTAGQAIWFM